MRKFSGIRGHFPKPDIFCCFRVGLLFAAYTDKLVSSWIKPSYRPSYSGDFLYDTVLALSGSYMRNKTEIKHCCWCSRKVIQYFMSVLFHVVRSALDDVIVESDESFCAALGSPQQLAVIHASSTTGILYRLRLTCTDLYERVHLRTKIRFCICGLIAEIFARKAADWRVLYANRLLHTLWSSLRREQHFYSIEAWVNTWNIHSGPEHRDRPSRLLQRSATRHVKQQPGCRWHRTHWPGLYIRLRAVRQRHRVAPPASLTADVTGYNTSRQLSRRRQG